MSGGRYEIGKDGVRRLVEEPTQPHPEGDAPRTADGTMIGADGTPVAPPQPPPAAKKER